MITVSFTKDTDSITLKLSGHAGADRAGHDIVCASASILAYTVAQAAMYMRSQRKLRRKPHIKLEDGDAAITVRPASSGYAEALHTFFVAEIGYTLLAQNYPQYVEITNTLGEAKALK